MPSSKSPTSLRIGAGRIPANVVSASALTSLASTVDTVDETSVVQVNAANTVLARVSAQMLALVDNSTANPPFTITLPEDSEVGDSITFVGTTNGLNTVSIDAAGGDLIHGFTNVERLVGPFFARTLVCTVGGGSGWVTASEKSGVQVISTSSTLERSGAHAICIVDTTSGDSTVTLPQRAQVGDRITVIKGAPSTAHSVTLDGFGSDTIDGRTTTTILSDLGSVTLLRVTSSAWATLSESTSFVNVTDTTNLSSTSLNTAKQMHVMVHTLDASWLAGTKTITLPTTNVPPGAVITITDGDGAAATSPIIVAAIAGWSGPGDNPAVPSNYTLDTGYSAITVIRTGAPAAGPATAWVIIGDSSGLVDNFTTLARTSARSDLPLSRMTVDPMFNWSHRKVAIHAEFSGLITNILPVDGFSAGGDIVLSSVDGEPGTVGVMRCTVPVGGSGYLHLGSLPTTPIFDPAVLLGFRAILTLQTANPGIDYDVAIGFGDDIGDVSGTMGEVLGDNGLYLFTRADGVRWGRVRRSGGIEAAGANMGFLVVGARYVLEYYRSSTNTWDGFVNGVRSAGGSTDTPTVLLNFGMMIRADDGGSAPYIVDVDSFTVFTCDMGTTRYT